MDSISNEIKEKLNAVYQKDYESEDERSIAITTEKQSLIKWVMKQEVSDEKKNQYIQEIMLFLVLQHEQEIQEQEKNTPIELIDEENGSISEEDRTWHDEEHKVYGCPHYIRGAKMLCPQCNQFFTCRLCHDAISSHQMNRYQVKYMACMYCLRIQEVAKDCKYCHKELGEYYCDICHFWKDLESPCFHCPDCNICRNGKGLGIDTYHCPKCNICMMLNGHENHTCIENKLFCDCPICGEFLQTSVKRTSLLICGHAIHEDCLNLYLRNNYVCPVCQKSIINTTEYFRIIDKWLEENPMPEEYKDMKRMIYCNDCGQTNEVNYHFVYNKCPNPDCHSYNTKVVKV